MEAIRGVVEPLEEGHLDEERADAELFIQLLERFGGMPIRSRKRDAGAWPQM